MIGEAGEEIEFRYWRASEQTEYFTQGTFNGGSTNEPSYTLVAGGQLGSFGADEGGPFILVLSLDPPCIPCATCTQYKASFNGDTETPLTADQKCAPTAGRCEVRIANVFTEECLNNDLVSCFESCGAPVSPSPSPPVVVVSPSPSPPVVVASPSPPTPTDQGTTCASDVCCVDFSPPPSPPPPPPPASPPPSPPPPPPPSPPLSPPPTPSLPPPNPPPPPTCNEKLFMTPGGSNQCACPTGQEFAPSTATMTKCCIPLVPGPMCGDNVDVCCQKLVGTAGAHKQFFVACR